MISSPHGTSRPIAAIVRTIALFLFTTASVLAQTSADGWTALRDNDLAQARRVLTQVVQANPQDARAWLGLYYEARLRGDEAASWKALRSALGTLKDPAPYIFATMSGTAFSQALYREGAGAKEILERATSEPDALGIIRAMAYERLGTYEQTFERHEDAKALFERMGAISTFRIVGPFDNISGSGHDKVFGPERTDDTTAVFKNASGGEIRWQSPGVQRLDRWIDMTYFASTHRGQFYAIVYVRSPKEQRAHLRIGTSGSFKLFLNDSTVRETTDEHNNDLDTYITECTLNEGWNKVLVKLGASDLDRCNFMLRITDAAGIPLKDLATSTSIQPYRPSNPRAVIIPNPFTTFFTARVAERPDELENYLLLADAHLRNDEVNDAIAVLRKARRDAPECLLVDLLLLEAYNRSDRTDDYLSLIEHASTVAPTLPLSLNYRFSLAISQDRIDDADSILTIMKQEDSTSTTFFESSMIVAQRRSDLRKLTDLLQQAYERFPSNYTYASLNASFASQGGQGTQKAIDILERHLRTGVSYRALETLAQTYQEAGNFDKALATYDRLLALIPVGVGYHSFISDVYVDRKDWKNALASIDRAIAIAPNISTFWSKRAVINKSMGSVMAAQADMQRALAIDPSNFEARTFIRELQNKPHPFTYLPQANVDEIIRNAPNASAYPNDGAIYLYDTKGRVVYDGSRCEVLTEYVVRVFTTAGIDAFKEVSIPTNSTLVVEKAVVRKPSGREIPADRGNGQLVFKTLEVGDFIHVKYRRMEYEFGRLGAYFEDSYSLNGTYPSLRSIYSLLTPEGYPFQWRAYGLTSEMKVTKNAFGELSQWELVNDPGIEFEEDMPSYDDINKSVEVSSIPNWEEIISWYHDIARTKTRTSVEVRETMDSLFPRDRTYSRDEIIAGVYRYITKDIRYSYVPFRQSGYVPQKAERVINTRIGDCKDVATLCISMLAERDIPAYHVLVRTSTSPFMRAPLPSIPFDHAIVMIPGDSLPMFLDLTADNVPIGSIPYADRDAFALVIKPGLREPMRLSKAYFRLNTMDVTTKVEVQDDNSAIITQTYVETGAGTQAYRNAWREITEKERDKGIVEMLSEDYPDVELLSVEIDDLDELTPTLRYQVKFSVPNYLMEAGGFLIARLPWERPITPRSAFSYEKRTYPIDLPYYHDSTHEVITLTVPKGYVLSEEKASVSFNLPQLTYERTATIRDGQLTVVRRQKNDRPYVMPDDYAMVKTAYNSMVKEDRRSILFMPKGTVVKLPKRTTK